MIFYAKIYNMNYFYAAITLFIIQMLYFILSPNLFPEPSDIRALSSLLISIIISALYVYFGRQSVKQNKKFGGRMFIILGYLGLVIFFILALMLYIFGFGHISG